MSVDIAGLIERARASVEAASADPHAPRPTEERYELQRVAQQFEAMLLTQMLREMRRAGESEKREDEREPGMGLGLDSFTETIDAELGLHLAKNKGLGLASQLMLAFDRMVSNTGQLTGTEGVDAAATPVTSLTGEPGQVSALAGKVTSDFGWRKDPFTGQATFHKGVDLQAAYGQDVQAAAAGTVVFSGEQRGYGTTVVIEHADGSRARYAHLSAATVASGAAIEAGQAIGRVGKSGRATGTHLHFEVTGPSGEPMSPSQWMP